MFSYLFPSIFDPSKPIVKSPEQQIIEDLLVNGTNDEKIKVLNYISKQRQIDADTQSNLSISGTIWSLFFTFVSLNLVIYTPSIFICRNNNRSEYCAYTAQIYHYFVNNSPTEGN
jgi:hypothetical protein